jgi:hypothetical protein
MRRYILLSLALIVSEFSVEAHPIGSPRSKILRDVEDFAIASCLAKQTQPYLKDQGSAWGYAIIEGGKAPVEDLMLIDDIVKREIAKGDTAWIPDDSNPKEGKAMPVLYCVDIIDTPAVRTAIQKAIIKLKPYYKKK